MLKLKQLVLKNVDFKDIISIEKYSFVLYGAKVDGAVDRNNSSQVHLSR